jgi:hypothetical protein
MALNSAEILILDSDSPLLTLLWDCLKSSLDSLGFNSDLDPWMYDCTIKHPTDGFKSGHYFRTRAPNLPSVIRLDLF